MRAAKYANYMAVGYNAFEVFLEFGQINADTLGLHVHCRIVTAPAIAKKFCRSLTQSLAQYETSYGPTGEYPLEDGKDLEGKEP